MTAMGTEKSAEWDTLYDSVVLQLRKLDEEGCPDVRALGESDVANYPRYMLSALSRSYVMARWMLLEAATQAADIDKLRVYDRFLTDPEVNSRLVEPTIMVLRRAGYENTAQIISPEHFARYDTAKDLFTGDMRGKLDWSETNMEMLQVVFVTGSDENRKRLSTNIQAALDMIRERGISRVDEIFHVMNSAGGGSMSLSGGAL